jgi:hypothetical protein
MKRLNFGKLWLMAGLFGLLLTVQAQPEKILEDYRPVIELSMQVIAMLELEKTTELGFSPEQASLLQPVLSDFQSKDTMTNDEAAAYQQQLSETILTPEQRDWVTARAEELYAENFSSNSRPSIGMSLGMRLMVGEPVNLVREGLSKDSLNELVELLKMKDD